MALSRIPCSSLISEKSCAGVGACAAGFKHTESQTLLLTEGLQRARTVRGPSAPASIPLQDIARGPFACDGHSLYYCCACSRGERERERVRNLKTNNNYKHPPKIAIFMLVQNSFLAQRKHMSLQSLIRNKCCMQL